MRARGRCSLAALTQRPPQLHSIAGERRENERVNFAVRILQNFKRREVMFADEGRKVSGL